MSYEASVQILIYSFVRDNKDGKEIIYHGNKICQMGHKERGTKMPWVILAFLEMEMLPNISQG